MNISDFKPKEIINETKRLQQIVAEQSQRFKFDPYINSVIQLIKSGESPKPRNKKLATRCLFAQFESVVKLHLFGLDQFIFNHIEVREIRDWLLAYSAIEKHLPKQYLINKLFNEIDDLKVTGDDMHLYKFIHANVGKLKSMKLAGLDISFLNIGIDNLEDIPTIIGLDREASITRGIQLSLLNSIPIQELHRRYPSAYLIRKTLSRYLFNSTHMFTFVNTLLTNLRGASVQESKALEMWSNDIIQQLGSSHGEFKQWKPYFEDEGLVKENYDWYFQRLLRKSISKYFSSDMNRERRDFWLCYANSGLMIRIPDNLPNAQALIMYLEKNVTVVEFYIQGNGAAYFYNSDEFENIRVSIRSFENKREDFYKSTSTQKKLYPALLCRKNHFTSGRPTGNWSVKWQGEFEHYLKTLGINLNARYHR